MVEKSINPYEEGGEETPLMQVFDKETDVLMNDLEYDFSVGSPQDQGGNIVYEVKGKDKQGFWEGKRRYSDFYLLWEVLCRRFPGVPIPVLPEKKAIGNKDILFLQDRTFYLQRFLRKLSRYEFVIESPEFLLFSRPQGMNVQKALEKLMPLSTTQKYERLQLITNININDYDVMKKE